MKFPFFHRSTLVMRVLLLGFCQLQLQRVHAWTTHTHTHARTTTSGNRLARIGSTGTVDQQQRRLGLERPDLTVCFMAMDDDDDDGDSSDSSTAADTATTATDTTATSKIPRPRPCYYQVQGKRFLRRQLQDIQPGQALKAFAVVSENLEAVKGPKIYLDVGVGSCEVDPVSGETVWSVLTSLVRLGGPNMKASVARKKASKIRQRCMAEPEEKVKEKGKGGGVSGAGLTVYVTRIDRAGIRLEVSVNADDGIAAAAAARKESSTLSTSSSSSKLAHVSTLQAGQELQGTIERIEDYGCLVRIPGLKRHGLLRIQSVADLYGTYIAKKQGMVDAGLERGAAVKVQVANVTGKRLLLEFTDSTKEQAVLQRQEQAEEKIESVRKKQEAFKELKAEKLRKKQEKFKVKTSDAKVSTATAVATDSTSTTGLSPEEEAAWAAYAAKDDDAEDDDDDDNDDDDDDEDYDDYDEDRDIEDSLGLGSY
jgi:predicted RNA-binding protein with RPS1 domain